MLLQDTGSLYLFYAAVFECLFFIQPQIDCLIRRDNFISEVIV